ncbi:MAG: transcriptional regulator [Oscillospiraceae bacterium]|nr:transcriptional regulator [Oscillospiraceae bacterium]
MEAPRFLRVDDIAEMLQCSESHAYKIMRELNDELKKKGKVVVSGRISRRYVEERLY